jgi:NADPH:quinone reductase-like Zn-dependent oxidoreductase
MKAVRIHAYGGADVLRYEDAPRPVPEAGEVLIQVHAAAVNPIDCKARSGYLRDWWDYALPFIPGWDVSGVIAELGSGVTQFQVGDLVYAMADFSRDGAYAEYIVIDAADIAAKPTAVTHIQAAAVPLAGLTAWQSLFDTANLVAGQTILIHGAAGGVGTFAVQFAKFKGAQVIGTASGRDAEFLDKLGVDRVLDYQTTRFEDVVHNADVVLDTRGGEVQQRSWRTLKPGGILVSIVSEPSFEAADRYGVRSAVVWVKPSASQLTEIAQLIDAGNVVPIVETVLPLSGASQAHKQSQHGHLRGKLVLHIA